MRKNFHYLASIILLTGVAFAQAPSVGTGSGATAGTVPAAATATSTAPVPAKLAAPLRVAVDPHAAPLIFKTGDKYSGLEADFARGLGEALGRPVVFVEGTPANLINLLLNDKADIVMSGMAINRMRQVRAAFCDAYLRIGEVAVCRLADIGVYKNNGNLVNLKTEVGVVAGSSGDVLVGEQFSFASRKSYVSNAAAMEALLDKKVDIVVTGYPEAIWENSENEAALGVVPTLLNQEDLAWAVRKDDDGLRAAANAYLEKQHAGGTLATMVRKWVPDATSDAIAPRPAAPAAAPAPAAGSASVPKATPKKN